MEADFSGWVTKAGLKCSDGRTIMPNAFQHQDKTQVPLVWQHSHNDPENVLGHMILENRGEEGVYGYGFFNGTGKAVHAKQLVEHGDINMMSIWANELIEKAKRVMHGAIREVSLVLSGANPGAVIENITIRHSGGEEEVLDEEAIIYTGLEFEHDNVDSTTDAAQKDDDDPDQVVYDSMTDEQKELVHSLIQHASTTNNGGGSDLTVQDVYDSMSQEQKDVLHFMVGEAMASVSPGTAQHDNLGDENDDKIDGNNDSKGTGEVKHNVFEKNDNTGGDSTGYTLSHSDMQTMLEEAKASKRSLKAVVEEFALAHAITDIDVLFPEARAIAGTPEMLTRRTEWVAKLMTGIRKSPFSRIKTSYADLTVAEARAKGYIKGSLKKEEFFRVAKRSTEPTTIYKKQKLDRDDMVDITDFDVVSWLKAEMRMMLDEEIARAILVGDGRAADDEDKVDEDRIRPIASDHELYTTTLRVNILDASSSVQEIADAIILNRSVLRGSGTPIFFTTEYFIGRFMTLRDTLGRRIYKDLAELASELRVSEIVPCEILEEYSDIVGIMVNPVDYVVGADKGGEVNMFDDFDIDYNQYKYLIETRISGALVKLKAALVIRQTASTDALVAPAAPTFDGTAVTIHDTTHVVYKNADTDAVLTNAGGPYTVAEGDTLSVVAEPASGYYVANDDESYWNFTNQG